MIDINFYDSKKLEHDDACSQKKCLWRLLDISETMDVIRHELIWMRDMNFYQSKKPKLDGHVAT